MDTGITASSTHATPVSPPRSHTALAVPTPAAPREGRARPLLHAEPPCAALGTSGSSFSVHPAAGAARRDTSSALASGLLTLVLPHLHFTCASSCAPATSRHPHPCQVSAPLTLTLHVLPHSQPRTLIAHSQHPVTSRHHSACKDAVASSQQSDPHHYRM